MKKSVIFILALVLFPLVALPQVQQGFVRTAGKPHQKGQPLGGVSIKVSGSFNAVKSDDPQGTFSIPMKDYKDGAGFTLQSVYKSGYELTDKDFLSRKHSFSTQVPLEIVMISRADVMRVQTEIEDRARATAEKKYHARLDELNGELEARKISEEHYRKELADLQRKQESFDALIATMAERYARTDYDKLDSLNKAINICIVEGDLDKADSLINSKGSIEQRIASLREQEQTLHETREELRKAEVALAEGEKEKERRKEEIAEDLYNKHSIALSHFEVDSAGYFMELRAELDTMNANYLYDAGVFISEYQTDYQKALHYLSKACRIEESLSDNSHSQAAFIYFLHSIGDLYERLGKYPQAVEYQQKAIRLGEELNSKNLLASCYGSLGTAYYKLGKNQDAMELFMKSIHICEDDSSGIHSALPAVYHNLGIVYDGLGKYQQALDCYQHAIALLNTMSGIKHYEIANVYQALCMTYYTLGDYEKSLDYCKKALEIRKKLFGDEHPDVALSYHSYATLLSYFGEPQALEFAMKSMRINEKIFGLNHANTAECYSLVGHILQSEGKYSEALEYYEKSLKIKEKVLGATHPDMASSYANMGTLYEKLKRYDVALKYYHKALDSFEKSGIANLELAKLYEYVAKCYKNSGNHASALEYYKKSLDLAQKLLGDKPHEIKLFVCYAIACEYDYLKDYSAALMFFQKALGIAEQFFGEGDNQTVSMILNAIYLTYHNGMQSDNSSSANEYRLGLEDFMKQIVFTVTLNDKGNNFILCALESWDINDDRNFADYISALPNNPLTVAYLKDDSIFSCRVDSLKQISFGIKKIKADKKSEVVKLYNDWKNGGSK